MKLQKATKDNEAEDVRSWSLELGTSLELGAWDLELRSLSPFRAVLEL
jgi:hypothetical protein